MTTESPSAGRELPAVSARWLPDDGRKAVVVRASAEYERQTLNLPLPAPLPGAESLQLEFHGEGGLAPRGFLHVYALRLSGSAEQGSTQVLASLDGETAVAEGTKPRDLKFHTASLGSVWLVCGPRPMIEIPLPAGLTTDAGRDWRLEITLRVTRDVEYLLARDHYLLREEELEKRLREAEDELVQARERLSYLTDFHDLIQRSLTWKIVRRLGLLPHYAVRVPVSAAREGLKLFRAGGVAAVRQGVHDWAEKRREGTLTDYERWRKKKVLNEPPAVTPAAPGPGAGGPMFSIVMPVFNTEPGMLESAIASVRAQAWPSWELCICDDASTRKETLDVLRRQTDERVRIERLERNAGISEASNRAAAGARGAYLAFLDHDDELHPEALSAVAAEIGRGAPDIVYTDEDFRTCAGHLDHPHFKPDYNPDLLLSHNYITHFLAMKAALFREIGGFRRERDGAQDYDLLLRAVERAAEIRHVPRALYHWRMSPTSTALVPDAKPAAHGNARLALEDTLARRDIAGTVEEGDRPHYFRVRRRIRGEPLVSIVIPFKDRPALLRTCVESLLEQTRYARYEVVGVTNDTTSASTWDLMRALRERDARVRFVEANIPFNFSRLVNLGVSGSRGEHVLLLNNDIEITEPGWLEALLEHAQRPEVGAVGGKLLFPNGTIQHAGIVVGLGGYAGYPHRQFAGDAPGYFNRLNVIQNVSAVTAAMLMVKKSVYEELDGFDETRFAVAYNDVDFCLRSLERGYLNVYTPYAQAVHHESLSRGYEVSEEKRQRFAREQENLLHRHGEIIRRGDPCFNPNFDHGRDDFRLAPRP